MNSLDLHGTAAIDRAKLLERCLGINAFADKLATAFIASLPNERSALKTVVANADLLQVAKQAHRLRGSASNLCANELSAAAEAVEIAARNELTDSIASLIEDVESAIDRLLSEFEDGITTS